MSKSVNQKGYGVIAGLLNLIFSIIIGIVAIRFVFRLIGANSANAIVSWFYNASQPLVSPFFGIFGHDANILTGRFEFDTLVALIFYGIIAAVVTSLFSRSYHRTHSI